jgi:hypothetical protein
VTSKDLTRQQYEILQAAVGRRIRYLGKLRDRINRLGWSPQDELWAATLLAFDRVQELFVKLHYLSCPGGVG